MSRDFSLLRNVRISERGSAGARTYGDRILHYAAEAVRAKDARTQGVAGIPPGRVSSSFAFDESSRGLPVRVAWTPKVGPFADESHAVVLARAFDSELQGHRSLELVDGAVIVVDVSGIDERAGAALRDARRQGIASLVFVDGIQASKSPLADFDARLAELETSFECTAVAVHLPWRDEHGEHLIDVLDQRLVIETESGRKRRRAPLPKSLVTIVAERRRRIVDVCAELDESVMGAHSVGMDVGSDELARVLRKATQKRDSRLVVVTCAASFADEGTSSILDAVVTYLPSPAERPPVMGIDPRRGVAVARFARDEDAFAALVFDTSRDPARGRVTWVRVYSGTLRADDWVLLFGGEHGERGDRREVGSLVTLGVDGYLEIEEAGAGSIVGVTGLGDVSIGTTLADVRAPITFAWDRASGTRLAMASERPARAVAG